MKETTAPPITQLEMTEADIEFAERMAAGLGYEQTAYTSSSALWGLFCLPENPAHVGKHAYQNSDPATFDADCRTCGGKHRDSVHSLAPKYRGGCIIKTAQFGFLFVADLEDLQLYDLHAETLEGEN